jgi:hypothetical protein
MKLEWLFPGAIVPVDIKTTEALVTEIKRLVYVAGGLMLKQGPDYERGFDYELGFVDGMQKQMQMQSSVDMAVNRMTKDKALKLALEALEGVLDDERNVLDASISGGLYEVVQCRDAITAIKEALAQPAQEPEWEEEQRLLRRKWFGHRDTGHLSFTEAVDATMEKLYAELEPAQEPPSEWALIKNILDEHGLQAISFVADWQAAHSIVAFADPHTCR